MVNQIRIHLDKSNPQRTSFAKRLRDVTLGFCLAITGIILVIGFFWTIIAVPVGLGLLARAGFLFIRSMFVTVPIHCPSCNTPLDIGINSNAFTCYRCKTRVLVDWEDNNQ